MHLCNRYALNKLKMNQKQDEERCGSWCEWRAKSELSVSSGLVCGGADGLMVGWA